MRGRYYGKLRAARMRAELTQAELAQKVGMTPTYISKLENDPFIQIRFDTLQRLADALETTVEEVWDKPYEVSDKGTRSGTRRGFAKAERTILRAFLKLDRRRRLRIVEVQKRLNERKEQKYADAGRSTEKRQPDP